MIVEEVLQWQQLRSCIPHLWREARGKRLLYIGANRLRAFHALTLWGAGYEMALVEAYAPNAEFWQNSGLFGRVYAADVRKIDLPPAYDVVFWWHGPEHIARGELAGVLARLERLAPLVILGCPNGEYAQDEAYGNPFERHLWSVQVRDLEALGYTVQIYRAATAELLAWRQL